MQHFLRKINDAYTYHQCFPNKTKKKKGGERQLSSVYSGLTGQDLIDRAVKIMREHPEYADKYDAILVEDDLDCRYKDKSEEEIEIEYNDNARILREAFGRDVPVVFLYASPEIESWFISDWNNCFCGVYGDSTYVPDLSKENRDLFLIRLHDIIKKEIVQDDIERFGYGDTKYTKMSEKLTQIFSPDYIQSAIMDRNRDSKEVYDIVCQSRSLFYSKRTHGSAMLRKADPEIIQRSCRNFFRKGFLYLNGLSDAI